MRRPTTRWSDFGVVTAMVIAVLMLGVAARVDAQAPRRAAYVLRGPGLDQEVVQLVVRTALEAGGTNVLEPSAVSAAMSFLPLAPGAQIDDAYAAQPRGDLGVDRLVVVQTVANPDGSLAIQILVADCNNAPSRGYGAAGGVAGLGAALSRFLGDMPTMSAIAPPQTSPPPAAFPAPAAPPSGAYAGGSSHMKSVLAPLSIGPDSPHYLGG